MDIVNTKAFCTCGNLLYTADKTEDGRVGYKLNDPKAVPSNLVNGAIYCVCPKCHQINKHRFEGSNLEVAHETT